MQLYIVAVGVVSDLGRALTKNLGRGDFCTRVMNLLVNGLRVLINHDLFDVLSILKGLFGLCVESQGGSFCKATHYRGYGGYCPGNWRLI